MAVALIVAAGSGERLGADRPKAFVALAGKPMVQWSVEALRGVPAIERIAVALPAGESAPDGTLAAPGGAARSQSVRSALSVVGEGDPVLVHDAARPLLTTELAERAITELERLGCDAVVAAARVSDTIKRADAAGLVEETLERSHLWAVQTPQVFRRHALERALEADEATLARATDDAWLVERNGGRVHIVEAPVSNLKVTTAGDLRAAVSALQARD
jgi:2-C-methyl-D-erythritol 4-phosphate cytidylyltransferase